VKEVTLDTAIELGSPYPYTLVVTVDKQGKPNVMGLSWWTFTSLVPPMIAISVGHARYTHECIEGNMEFVICFPSKEQGKAAWQCGIKSGRKTDKFADLKLTASPAKVVKPPIIERATLAYECKVVGMLECGDHTLYNSEIVAVHGNPELAEHIYSIHYRKLFSMDSRGNVSLDMEYK
jgi:flavin reductase (DIM6/NTAB) family NADH-FMN oxidoreductase RutF